MYAMGWIGIVYFVLSFMESLHNNDKRITKQTKSAAIICLGVALLLPVILNFA
jgi:hypothetical protein